MSTTTILIDKPRRWDEPFDPDFAAAEIDQILAAGLFRDIDRELFPARLPLSGIIKNDTRIVNYQPGDIIVRRGDYGNSAFLILEGAVLVDAGIDEDTAGDAMLGRRVSRRYGFFGAISQLWTNRKWPEGRGLAATASGIGGAEQIESGVSARRTLKDDVRIYFPDIDLFRDRAIDLHEYHDGTVFGEVAALGRTARTATVIAEKPTRLLEIRWQGLRELRKYAPPIKKYIEQRYRETSLEVHLSEAEIFRHLPREALEKVKAATSFETYGDFDWYGSYKRLAAKDAAGRLQTEPVIAKEGDYPNGIYLMRSGFARISNRLGHGELTLGYIGKGRIFGLAEIVHNWREDADIPLQSTLRSVGYVDVLFVPTPIVEQYVLPGLPERLFPELPRLADQQLHVTTQSTSDTEMDSAKIEFLVENRVINGTSTMLIDLDRCTRCDECVRACSTAHDDNPRFLRSGPEFGHYMVANACMHCKDPVCLIGCPTGAISRNAEGGEVTINDKTCIGCATCYNNCPYDAIRMVQIRGADGSLVLDEETNLPIRKATKCDLCHDQPGGPACERACPHDALIRADMSDADMLGRWFNR